MSKPKLFLITSSYPYGLGEQFLETEILYWSQQTYFDTFLMPNIKTGIRRDLPENINLDLSLINEKYRFHKIKYLLKAMLNFLNYKKEIKFILHDFRRLPVLLRYAIRMEIYKTFFSYFFEKNKINLNNCIFYTYWNDSITYALSEFKKKYNFILISRIHGYDIYEERRLFRYMPLKRMYINQLDKIFIISEFQKDYLIEKYKANKNIIELSRLGVLDRRIKTESSNKNDLVIVSCSFLVKVKRVDKIIKSISKLAEKMNYLNICWYHIGDGPLKGELIELSEKLFTKFKNLKYKFLGHLKNEEVFDFYRKNKIDLFINLSESEGLPVSIMEALSCGIPVIAPNIGGILEAVVTGYNGILLSELPDEEEVLSALMKVDFFKNEKIRQNAYNMFKEKFDAEKNYKVFIENLYNIYLEHKRNLKIV